MRHLVFACAVVTFGATASPLAAHPALRPETVNVVVSTKGLDLTTEKGVRRLLKRLARGASTACAEAITDSPLLPQARRDFLRCRAKALADVVARSDLPQLQRQFAVVQGARMRVSER